MAENLGKGKVSAKPTKAKGRAEKDKYVCKRRDETIHMNIKKASSEDQSGYSLPPLLVDASALSGASTDPGIEGHMHQISLSGNDSQLHATTPVFSLIIDIKPPEGSRKIVEGGIEKAKVHKQQTAELSVENAISVEEKKTKKRKKDESTEQVAGELNTEGVTPVDKKRKKDASTEQLAAGELNTESVTLVDQKREAMETEASEGPVQLPPANSSSGVAVEKVSGLPLDVPSTVKNQHDILNKDVVMGSSSSPPIEQQQPVNTDLLVLVRDLHGLALDPSHGVERGCLSLVPLVFLKYRSLVFQKSLALFPSENEKSVARTTTYLSSPANKAGHKSKLMKPPLRPDGPTKSGKKRSPSDHPEPVKKKKLIASEDIDKRKKPIDLYGIKKKIISDVKLTSVEKKIPQRPMELQQENAKVITSKSPSTLPKQPILHSSKTMGRIPSSPTMLVMKFPTGAALPSGAELRAKFTRFGPMDHSATRVFWKTHTCRLVFHQKTDAQAALKFAIGTSSLFGNTDVRSYIREVEVEAAEPLPVKVQKEDLDAAAKAGVQLKSCLKKPSEEGGNGNGRGTRVKFVLGGDGSSMTQQFSSVAVADNTSSSSYAQSMDVSSSKKLPKLIPDPSVGPSASHQFQLPNNNTASSIDEPQLQSQSRPVSRPYNNTSRHMMMMMPKPPNNDISQQLLNLLARCSDVVNHLSGVLGYVPYHSL